MLQSIKQKIPWFNLPSGGFQLGTIWTQTSIPTDRWCLIVIPNISRSCLWDPMLIEETNKIHGAQQNCTPTSNPQLACKQLTDCWQDVHPNGHTLGYPRLIHVPVDEVSKPFLDVWGWRRGFRIIPHWSWNLMGLNWRLHFLMETCAGSVPKVPVVNVQDSTRPLSWNAEPPGLITYFNISRLFT